MENTTFHDTTNPDNIDGHTLIGCQGFDGNGNITVENGTAYASNGPGSPTNRESTMNSAHRQAQGLRKVRLF